MKKIIFFKTFFIVSLIFMLAFSFTNVFAITGLNQTKSTNQLGQTTQSWDQERVGGDKGLIDWEKGFIRVTGTGVSPEGANKAAAPLLAQRAAKTDAYRNAVEVLNGVRINGRTYLKDLVLENDEVTTAVQGLIQGGQFEKPSYTPVDDLYQCEIVLVIPVGGQRGLVSALADYEKQEQTSQNVPDKDLNQTPAAAATATATPSADQNQPVVSTNSDPYTGIIIDARRLALKPALYPQIFSINGNLLYNQSMVDLDEAQFSTIVGYSRSMDRAVTMSRVGSNPLKLKAISVVKAAGGENTDIFLNFDASNAFHQAASNGNLLSKAAIVIVIN